MMSLLNLFSELCRSDDHIIESVERDQWTNSRKVNYKKMVTEDSGADGPCGLKQQLKQILLAF